MRRYRWEIFILLLLMVGTLAVFWRGLGAEFVQWDDDILIYNNPHLTGLNVATVRWAVTTLDYVVRYQPLTWLTWAVVEELGGHQPRAYHAASLLFHCLNVGLVFLLLRKLLVLVYGAACAGPAKNGDLTSKSSQVEGNSCNAPDIPLSVQLKPTLIAAGTGALLWGIHPCRVEAVAWVSAMLHCQAAFFLLLSVLCYLEAAQAPTGRTQRRAYFSASVAAYAASLFSYPIALCFAVPLVVLDFYPLRRFAIGPKRWWWNTAARRVWLEKLPFVLVAVSVVAITLWTRLHLTRGWIEAASLADFGLADRAMQAFYIWAYYAWKPWWPFHLSPVYTTLLEFKPGDGVFVFSALIVIVLTLALWQRRRDWPALAALWTCHLSLLVPVLGLTEHPHYANDRYSYVVAILWSIALSAGLLKLRDQRGPFALGVVACLCLAAVCGGLSARQTRIWQNSVALFRYMIDRLANDPYSADAHWRLAMVYADQKKDDEAQAHYMTALKIAPNFAEPYYHWGLLLERQGKGDAALEQYAATLRLKPDFIEAHVRLGFLLAERGRRQEAIAHLQHALRLDPGLVEARRKLVSLAGEK